MIGHSLPMKKHRLDSAGVYCPHLTYKLIQIIVNIVMFTHATADLWKVVLKGESKDYIHASFANVRV